MNSLSEKIRIAKAQGDTEFQQALIRITIVFIVFVYQLVHSIVHSAATSTLLWVVFIETCSLAIMSHLLWRPGINQVRRYSGMLNDNLAITVFLQMASDRAAIFLFVYLWVAIGNGFRFGTKHLYASATLATIGYSSLLFFDPFWKQHLNFGLGLVFTIVAVTGYTGVLLTQLKRAKETLEKMATHDNLTGLPNRALLMDRLHHSLFLNTRMQRQMGLIYFDLDGFKTVNDRHGHQCGDELLREVARQVKDCIRTSDMLARIGGDEFVIILDTLRNEDDLKMICNRILERVTAINKINNCEIKVGSSVGALLIQDANLKDEANSSDNLIKAADDLMYKAKKSGKGRIEYAILNNANSVAA